MEFREYQTFRDRINSCKTIEQVKEIENQVRPLKSDERKSNVLKAIETKKNLIRNIRTEYVPIS